eukprot:CAMPEP_0171455246 /NCGR_PEP_ID=MMETSP0945-20130129/2222_1 /TAXON_ID=109269 /ORGANISM="Vaucheria litorea, Strain CCMP2940" /LENGTH=287 /DNA_ID=CAMNT_0011980457 /DNA_START=226 /DNA_END=1089 /DNA_ORIENTATION=+
MDDESVAVRRESVAEYAIAVTLTFFDRVDLHAFDEALGEVFPSGSVVSANGSDFDSQNRLENFRLEMTFADLTQTDTFVNSLSDSNKLFELCEAVQNPCLGMGVSNLTVRPYSSAISGPTYEYDLNTGGRLSVEIWPANGPEISKRYSAELFFGLIGLTLILVPIIILILQRVLKGLGKGHFSADASENDGPKSSGQSETGTGKIPKVGGENGFSDVPLSPETSHSNSSFFPTANGKALPLSSPNRQSRKDIHSQLRKTTMNFKSTFRQYSIASEEHEEESTNINRA